MISLGAVIIVHNGDFRFLLRHAKETFPARNSVRFRSDYWHLISTIRLPSKARRETEKAIEAE
jgi:hypothetical protein